MGIDHRRFNILVVEKFLDRSNVITALKQMRGIVSEGETTDMLDYARFTNCFLDGRLKNRLVMEKILCILLGNRFLYFVHHF